MALPPEWNFGKLFHEDCAQFTEFVDNVLVMDNFFANVDRRPVEIERDLYHVDSANHSGTKTAGFSRYIFFRQWYWRRSVLV